MLLNPKPCRLSALEAVIEDGETLQGLDTHFSPEMLSRLCLVYSQTATSLALMSCTVQQFGRQQQQQQQRGGTAHDVESGSNSGAHNIDVGLNKKSDSGLVGVVTVPGPFCGAISAFGRTWSESKADLSRHMALEQRRYWANVVAAPAGSPNVVPNITKVRERRPATPKKPSAADDTERGVILQQKHHINNKINRHDRCQPLQVYYLMYTCVVPHRAKHRCSPFSIYPASRLSVSLPCLDAHCTFQCGLSPILKPGWWHQRCQDNGTQSCR